MKSPLARLLIGFLKLILQLFVLLLTGRWVKIEQQAPEVPLPPGASEAEEATWHGEKRDIRQSKGQGTFSPHKPPAPDRGRLVAHVKHVVAQQPADVRVQLTHVALFAQRSFHELEVALRGHGLPLRKRTYVALSAVSPAEAPLIEQAVEHTPQAAFVVPRDSLDSLEPYLEAMRFRAGILAEDSYLIARLRRDYRLPKANPGLLRLLASNDPALRMQAMLALWLRPLVAEAWLSVRLGPSYVAYLLRGLQAQNLRTQSVVEKAQVTASKPPLILRIETALQALMYTGTFGGEVEALERSVDESVGNVAVFTVADPSVPGQVEVPLAVFRAQALSVVDDVFDSEFPGLGELSLFDLPGVALSEADHAGALVQVREITGGERGMDAMEDLMLRALVQVTVRKQNERDAARSLRETLGDSTSKKGARDLPRVPTQASGLPAILSVKSAFRDPSVLRDAVVLGALMGTRQPVLRRRGDKTRPS